VPDSKGTYGEDEKEAFSRSKSSHSFISVRQVDRKQGVRVRLLGGVVGSYLGNLDQSAIGRIPTCWPPPAPPAPPQETQTASGLPKKSLEERAWILVHQSAIGRKFEPGARLKTFRNFRSSRYFSSLRSSRHTLLSPFVSLTFDGIFEDVACEH
jgi:hypothetical protein